MEGAPRGIDVDAVRNSIAALPGVREVHDLHVWSITTGLEALSAHVVMDESRSQPALLAELSEKLEHEFGIGHITVQAEYVACGTTAHAH
jgi:cobalt-zinc-cadmium efflux system protein